ncbi:hypothetical protein HDU98_004662, partial [Podochytrium sp. JEL0797]
VESKQIKIFTLHQEFSMLNSSLSRAATALGAVNLLSLVSQVGILESTSGSELRLCMKTVEIAFGPVLFAVTLNF